MAWYRWMMLLSILSMLIVLLAFPGESGVLFRIVSYLVWVLLGISIIASVLATWRPHAKAGKPPVVPGHAWFRQMRRARLMGIGLFLLCLAAVWFLRGNKLAVLSGFAGAFACFSLVVLATGLLAHYRKRGRNQGKELET